MTVIIRVLVQQVSLMVYVDTGPIAFPVTNPDGSISGLLRISALIHGDNLRKRVTLMSI